MRVSDSRKYSEIPPIPLQSDIDSLYNQFLNQCDNMKIPSIITLSGFALLFSAQTAANHNSMESLKARVSAVGTLSVGGSNATGAMDENSPADTPDQPEALTTDGQSVYQTNCAACHSAGIAGSPLVGDVDEWAVRLEQGLETLVKHAIEGYIGSAGVMPAKGGNPTLADEAVAAAVQFMVDQSR